MSVEETHDLKETLTVEVETPGHDPRGAESELFRKTKAKLYESSQVLFTPTPEAGRCFICGKTEQELGEPLESHHMGIEWSFANAPILWDMVEKDFPHFDWKSFNPATPMVFVDDMEAQGLLLCKKHHTGKDEGIHNLPFGLWLMQRYLANGYKFSDQEIINHGTD